MMIIVGNYNDIYRRWWDEKNVKKSYVIHRYLYARLHRYLYARLIVTDRIGNVSIIK